MAHKKFQNLNLKDAFLFSAALSDEETCRLILKMILQQSLPRVTVHAEHTLLFCSDFRSVRLDIYADDEMQVGYNLEMQNENEYNLPKRSRYHQSEMDVTSLKPGQDFRDLKPGYVIFICTFDPFGRGLYRYTFEQRCLKQMPWDNHYPVFYSLIIGGFLLVGYLLNNLNLGVALYSLAQLLSMAWGLGFFLEWLQKKGVKKSIIYLSLCYFAAFPLFGNYAIVMWKDPWFSIVLLMLGMFLYDHVVVDHASFPEKKESGLLCCSGYSAVTSA